MRIENDSSLFALAHIISSRSSGVRHSAQLKCPMNFIEEANNNMLYWEKEEKQEDEKMPNNRKSNGKPANTEIDE